MHKGILPVVAGATVLLGGCTIKHKLPILSAGLIGYGLAHIVLGGNEYVQTERKYSCTCLGMPVGKIKKKIADVVL